MVIFKNMKESQLIEPNKFEELAWLDRLFFLREARNPFLFPSKRKGFLALSTEI